MIGVQNISGFFTAYDYEDITIDATAGGKPFTAAKVSPTATEGSIPTRTAHARLILAQVEGADIRYSIRPGTVPVSGGPGFLAPQGTLLEFENYQAMKDFKAIRETGVNATLRVFYLK